MTGACTVAASTGAGGATGSDCAGEVESISAARSVMMKRHMEHLLGAALEAAAAGILAMPDTQPTCQGRSTTIADACNAPIKIALTVSGQRMPDRTGLDARSPAEGTTMSYGRPVADPEETGGPGEDGSARCGH